MEMQRHIETLAYERHDTRCSKGQACDARDWHVRNDYMKNAARDSIAIAEADIASMRRHFGVR